VLRVSLKHLASNWSNPSLKNPASAGFFFAQNSPHVESEGF